MTEVKDAEFICPQCGNRETYLEDETPWCDKCTCFGEWPFNGGSIVEMEKQGRK